MDDLLVVGSSEVPQAEAVVAARSQDSVKGPVSIWSNEGVLICTTILDCVFGVKLVDTITLKVRERGAYTFRAPCCKLLVPT